MSRNAGKAQQRGARPTEIRNAALEACETDFGAGGIDKAYVVKSVDGLEDFGDHLAGYSKCLTDVNASIVEDLGDTAALETIRNEVAPSCDDVALVIAGLADTDAVGQHTADQLAEREFLLGALQMLCIVRAQELATDLLTLAFGNPGLPKHTLLLNESLHVPTPTPAQRAQIGAHDDGIATGEAFCAFLVGRAPPNTALQLNHCKEFATDLVVAFHLDPTQGALMPQWLGEQAGLLPIDFDLLPQGPCPAGGVVLISPEGFSGGGMCVAAAQAEDRLPQPVPSQCCAELRGNAGPRG